MSGSKMARPAPATPHARREGPGWRFARSLAHAFGTICRNAGRKRAASPRKAAVSRGRSPPRGDPDPVIVTTTGIRARGCDNDGVDGPPGGGRAPGNAPAVPPGTAGYLLGQPPSPCGWSHSREVSGVEAVSREASGFSRSGTADAQPLPRRRHQEICARTHIWPPKFRQVPNFRDHQRPRRRDRTPTRPDAAVPAGAGPQSHRQLVSRGALGRPGTPTRAPWDRDLRLEWHWGRVRRNET